MVFVLSIFVGYSDLRIYRPKKLILSSKALTIVKKNDLLSWNFLKTINSFFVFSSSFLKRNYRFLKICERPPLRVNAQRWQCQVYKLCTVQWYSLNLWLIKNISLQKLLELMNTVFTSCLLFLEYIDIYFQDVAENTDTLFFANNVGPRKF